MANSDIESALDRLDFVQDTCDVNAEVDSYLQDVRADLVSALDADEGSEPEPQADPDYEPDTAPALEGDEADDEPVGTTYDYGDEDE